MAPVLGYWSIRAQAEPIRFLLHFVEEDFDDKRYNFGPNMDKSEWLEVKSTFDLDFPNLPYYVDDDVKLTQSKAILRYLARKHGLAGETEEEQIQLDVLEGQLADTFMGVHPKVLLSTDLDSYKEDYAKNAHEKLQLLSDYLGDKKWMLGDRITYADFMAYDVVDLHRILMEDILEPYPNLLEYLSRFEELEGIQKYMGSEDYNPPPWVQQ